ncbi:MAG: DNA alkylation repair protein [Crocinitomicaceae bacterium]|nr:DNA alkylation repair protein [Crocinitomicaceae bacterium]
MTTELINELRKEMEVHQNPKIAVNMSAYLKDLFACYGIKSPVRNEIQKAWFRTIPKEINRWDIVYLLWDLPQREYHYIAIDYLNKMPKNDFHIDDHKLLEEIITTHSWWDSVDSIASNYVGKYFQLFPEKKDEVITRWRNSDNMWLNRTCLIFQLKYKDDVDFELLKDLIIQYKEVKEFFIQKAIGWSLRQYSKFNSADVRAFVIEAELEGLAKREATKYL